MYIYIARTGHAQIHRRRQSRRIHWRYYIRIYIYICTVRSVGRATADGIVITICPPTRAGIRDSGSFSSLQAKLCVFLEPLYCVRLKPLSTHVDPGQNIMYLLYMDVLYYTVSYVVMRDAHTQRPRALQRFKSYSHSQSQSQSHLREPDRHSTVSGDGEREIARDERLHILHQATIDARAAKTIESSLYLPDITPYMNAQLRWPRIMGRASRGGGRDQNVYPLFPGEGGSLW